MKQKIINSIHDGVVKSGITKAKEQKKKDLAKVNKERADKGMAPLKPKPFGVSSETPKYTDISNNPPKPERTLFTGTQPKPPKSLGPATGLVVA